MAIGSEARSTFLAIVKGDASQAITEFKKLEGTVSKSTHGATAGTSKFQMAAQGLKAELLAAAKSPAVLAAGVAAAGAGAVMAANKFSDLAKRSIDLSKATALSVEESSKWIAVADDFGISADALQAGVGRIGKTLDSAKWDQYGIATRDASGAAKNANDIFLQALDVLGRTTNETERARIGNDLFGKGYANIAPMIGKTRAEYEQMLGAVSSGQTITAGEAKRAEEWRLAQDRLSDAFNDLVYAFGDLAVSAAPLLDVMGALVEKASDLLGLIGEGDLSKPLQQFGNTANKAELSTSELIVAFDQFQREVGMARSGLDKTGAIIGELFEIDGTSADLVFDNYKKAIAELAATAPQQAGHVLAALTELVMKSEELGQTDVLRAKGLNLDNVMLLGEIAAEAAGGMENLGWATEDTGDAMSDASGEIGNAADAASDLGSAAQLAKVQLKLLQDQIDGRKSFISLQIQLRDTDSKIKELTADYAEGKISADDYYLGVADASLDAQGAVADYVGELDNITEEQRTELLTTYDPASLATMLNEIQIAADNRAIELTFEVDRETRRLLNGSKPAPGMGEVGYQKDANGGRSSGGLTLVGEYGPEMVNLPAGAMVSTAAQTRQMLSGGGGITVVVNAPVGANMIEAGRQVADALNDYYRSGGQRVA